MNDRQLDAVRAAPHGTGNFLHGALRRVHLELTTRCNARCPMCPRTGRGATRPGLKLVELSADDIRAILSPAILGDLHQIDLCGGFGDPLVARSFDDVLDYVWRENSTVRIDIYTNGSLNKAAWWSELAERIDGRGQVVFGIDGLEDTHALYRIGTSFEHVIRNARRFIEAGGRAQWDFLVFRHNQHQVDAARDMAKALGFVSFSPKVSGRFYKRYYEETPSMESPQGFASFPVYDRSGSHVYDLELPRDPRFRNPTLERLKSEVTAHGSIKPTLDRACVACRAIDDRTCFISAEGTVFPCCWTYGASKYGDVFGMSESENLQVAELLARHGGAAAIDARTRSLYEIIDGPFFAALAHSWRLKSIGQGKTKICARMCGGVFSQSDQFVDPALSPWQAGASGSVPRNQDRNTWP